MPYISGPDAITRAHPRRFALGVHAEGGHLTAPAATSTPDFGIRCGGLFGCTVTGALVLYEDRAPVSRAERNIRTLKETPLPPRVVHADPRRKIDSPSSAWPCSSSSRRTYNEQWMLESVRLPKRPAATRPPRAGRGGVESANTVKPLSKNPGAIQFTASLTLETLTL